jgi:Fic family protein
VLQLHRDLFQFAPGGGGHWKSTDNDIMERRPDGTSVIRFKPVPAHLTADAMERLHTEFSATLDAGTVEPLLLIPAYVLDFLCIHPFADGNGRMARLLSLLLLYQAGYEVGRYISLETVIGVMLVKAYRDFEDRVGATGAKRGAKRDMIRDVVNRLPNEFRYADLERALPAVSRPTIARALRELSAEGVVRCVGRGRDATWEKTPA